MASSDRHDDEVIARLEALHAPWRARLPEEIERKYDKMAESPFGYFRGTAPLFHQRVQRLDSRFLGPETDWLLLNGDVHLQNYGARRDAAGIDVFDLADFDEAAHGPVVHDVWRLATSVVLAARAHGLSDSAIGASVEALAADYGRSLAGFADRPQGATQFRLTAKDTRGHVRKRIDSLADQSREEFLAEIGSGSKWRSVARAQFPAFEAALETYRQTLPDPVWQQASLQLIDIHERRGAGNGSLGRHRYHLRVETGDAGTLILEFKEQTDSALRLTPVAARPRTAPIHHGQRVAEAIRRLQPQADPLTGWTALAGLPFLVREKSPFEASLKLEKLTGGRDWQALAAHAGQLLARTHALGDTDRQALASTALRIAAAGSSFADELHATAFRLADETEDQHRAFERWRKDRR